MTDDNGGTDDAEIEAAYRNAVDSYWNNDPGIIEFFAGTFYRTVNATAAYIAAYAAASLGAILADSWLLSGLKWALTIAFLSKVFHAALLDAEADKRGCALSIVRFIAVLALVFTATFAANSAVDAGLTQLDGDRSAKFAKAERARQKWKAVGVRYACYDPDFHDRRACPEIARRLDAEQRAIMNEPTKK